MVEMLGKRETNKKLNQNIRIHNNNNNRNFMQSKQFTLNKKDALKIAKGAGIAIGGALLTYLAQTLPNVDFGAYSALVVALASILINAGLKFIEGKK